MAARRAASHVLVVTVVIATLVWPSVPTTAATAVVMYPPPGTATAAPETTISVREVGAGDLGAVTVTGSTSGVLATTIRPHRDGNGVTLLPDRPFAPGERVVVSADIPLTDAGSATFTVATPGHLPDLDAPPWTPPAGPPRVTRFLTEPEIVAPVVATSGDGIDGLVLSTPAPTTTTPQAVMITDADGRLVWWRAAGRRAAVALLRTTWQGEPVLAWFAGEGVRGYGWFRGEWIVVDEAYEEVGRIRAANGLHADVHDLQLTPHGTALVVAYQPVVRDARGHGGDEDTIVLDAVVQEVDPATGDVWFEWHALDHIPLSWSLVTPDGDDVLDYVHLNAAAMDPTGDVLVTMRHTSMVAQIDRRTGRLEWVLGGPHATVEVLDDRGVSMPHHARWRADGTLSVFDNGVGVDPPTSRGVVYELDQARRTARPVTTYVAEPPVFTATQGSLQHVDDDTAVASWGELGSATVFTDAEPTATIDLGAPSYRILIADWTGRPAAEPVAVVRDGHVHVSWNGATEVATWELLRGPDAARLRVVGRRPSTSFETRLPVTGAGDVMAVRPLDVDGDRLGPPTPVGR